MFRLLSCNRPPVRLAVFSFIAVCLALSFGAGCGGGSDSSSGSSGTPSQGPHSGPVFKLPGDQGFVELTMELEGRGTVVVAYALKSDLKSPMEKENAPGDLKLKIRDMEDQSMHDIPLTLKAKPNAKDPAGAVRFASPPGVYGFNVFDGELSGTMKGQSFSEKAYRSAP